MENILGYIELVFMLVCSIGIGYGVDIKKWHGWAYVLSGFVLGVLMGFNLHNMGMGIVTGTFLALLMIWLGPIMLRRRRIAFGDSDKPHKK